MRSSASLVAVRSFVISDCMLLTRVWSFPSSVPEPVPDMASFLSSAVFCMRCFLATTMLAWAVRSQRFACSTASFKLSEIVSPAEPTAPSAAVASVIFDSSPSAAATFASTSWRRKARFLSAVLALNCCKRSRPSSKRFCNMSISSRTALAGPSVNRATSTNFRATNVWASAIAVCTLVAILSASCISASSSSPFWLPRRNGNSASAILCSSSSALLTFSDTSLSKVSAATRICVSFTVLRTSSNFSCDCRARSCSIFTSSSASVLPAPPFSAAFNLESMRRVVADKADWAVLRAASVSLIASTLSPPRGAVIMAAFSTSISAPASFDDSSSYNFFAWTLCS
mmetsp:Transcript_63686/g.177115  ORF Transcript_63686/g.177115 Transcript_63686/m.177115 type:complete len:342 (-) Transcript_63686:1346-2371(-)